jgi:hypothetical protein
LKVFTSVLSRKTLYQGFRIFPKKNPVINLRSIRRLMVDMERISKRGPQNIRRHLKNEDA